MAKSRSERLEIPEIELDSFLHREYPGGWDRFKRQQETLKDRAAILSARMLMTDVTTIRKALEAHETDWYMFDRFYRIYHLSFKMYHLNILILRYCELLLACIGEQLFEEKELFVVDPSNWTFIGSLHENEDPENAQKREKMITITMKKLEQLGFHPLFRQVISSSLLCHFHSNERDVWYEHQMKMSSAWVHTRQACWATVEEISCAQKEKRLPGTSLAWAISPEAALFREVWNLNLFIFDDMEELTSRVELLSGQS